MNVALSSLSLPQLSPNESAKQLLCGQLTQKSHDAQILWQDIFSEHLAKQSVLTISGHEVHVGLGNLKCESHKGLKGLCKFVIRNSFDKLNFNDISTESLLNSAPIWKKICHLLATHKTLAVTFNFSDRGKMDLQTLLNNYPELTTTNKISMEALKEALNSTHPGNQNPARPNRAFLKFFQKLQVSDPRPTLKEFFISGFSYLNQTASDENLSLFIQKFRQLPEHDANDIQKIIDLFSIHLKNQVEIHIIETPPRNGQWPFIDANNQLSAHPNLVFRTTTHSTQNPTIQTKIFIIKDTTQGQTHYRGFLLEHLVS